MPKKLPNRPFSSAAALKAGLTKYALKQLIAQGILDRLSRGLYQLSDKNTGDPESQYETATLRCGMPSAVCLLSALDHYHLTDQIPKQTWMLVPHSKRTLSKDLKLVRARRPRWDIGIEKRSRYWITTPERTLVECLVHKQRIGSQVALAALKKALDQKRVKLGPLCDMAKKMGVEHRILQYLEALAS